MDCTEARYLIDQGVAPGPRASVATQLGFHLARCAECRAYREQQSSLLASLLELQEGRERPPSMRAPAAAPQPPARRASAGGLYADLTAIDAPQQQPVAPQGRQRIAWAVGLGMSMAFLGVVLWLGGIALRAQANIAAMVVTTGVPRTPPQPTATVALLAAGGVPIAPEPLIVARATQQPQPSSSALPAEVPPTPTIASQHAASPQPTARVVVTATPWPTLEAPLIVVPEATATAQVAEPAPGEPFTLLILGNDRRPGETGVPRTDAIMLARIDPQRGRVALLSFPRDLWVTIPGYGQNRINAAYVWGEIYGAEGGGLGLARATVSNLIGRPIDYVVMVDFEGFIGLIDSIGGVTVDVEKELDDPRFPTMDYGYTHAHFDPGPQHMDGVAALTYSRIRHPDSDFARIKRQQAVLVAIGQRLQERGDLQNLLAADSITGALRGYVQTTVPQERIIGAVWALRSLGAGQVERYTLDSDQVSFGIGNDRYAELPLPGAIEQLVRQLYGQ